MKLSDYAKQNNISYRTAYRHYKNGWIKGAYQLKSGTIVVPDHYERKNKTKQVVLFSGEVVEVPESELNI